MEGFFVRWVMIGLVLAGAAGCRMSSEIPGVRNVHTVVPGVLVRGGQPGKHGLKDLRERYGVKTVVNFNDVTNKSEAKAAAEQGLNYLPLNNNPFHDVVDRDM